MFSLVLYILLSMVGAVFDDFRAFQTAFKAFQDETNRLFVVKKSNSVDPVNNSVILLYLTTISFISIVNAEFIKKYKVSITSDATLSSSSSSELDVGRSPLCPDRRVRDVALLCSRTSSVDLSRTCQVLLQMF